MTYVAATWRTHSCVPRRDSSRRPDLQNLMRIPPRRRLPHHYPQGKWLFLTWHLHASLPHALYPPAYKLSDGQAFVWMDRYLDTTRVGPM